MSNLRVTDVQAVLRKFAGLGHDVTSDPRAVNLEGRSYGMPVSHHLEVSPSYSGNVKPPAVWHMLTSHIAQAEKPVISRVLTSHRESNVDDFDNVRRDVTALIPTRTKIEDEPHADSFYTWRTPEGKGIYRAQSSAPKGSLLWTPDKYKDDVPSGHSDVHEALEHHRTGEIPYGQIHTSEGDSEMTPKDKFDFKNAFSLLAKPSIPHKGLVTVKHGIGKDSSLYVYDPETEQMFKHGDYGV